MIFLQSLFLTYHITKQSLSSSNMDAYGEFATRKLSFVKELDFYKGNLFGNSSVEKFVKGFDIEPFPIYVCEIIAFHFFQQFSSWTINIIEDNGTKEVFIKGLDMCLFIRVDLETKIADVVVADGVIFSDSLDVLVDMIAKSKVRDFSLDCWTKFSCHVDDIQTSEYENQSLKFAFWYCLNIVL